MIQCLGLQGNREIWRDFSVAENSVKWGGQREMTFKPRTGEWMISQYGPMWGKAFQLQGRALERPRVRPFILRSSVLLARPDKGVQAVDSTEGVCRANSLLVTSQTSRRTDYCKPWDLCTWKGGKPGKCQECCLCLEALKAEVSPRAQKPLSVCLGWWQTAWVHHFCCTAGSKSQLVIAKFWDLLLGEK